MAQHKFRLAISLPPAVKCLLKCFNEEQVNHIIFRLNIPADYRIYDFEPNYILQFVFFYKPEASLLN